LFHHPHGILVDLRFGFGAGGIALKYFTGKFFAERFSDLAPARIMDTNEGDFWFVHFFLLKFEIFKWAVLSALPEIDFDSGRIIDSLQ